MELRPFAFCSGWIFNMGLTTTISIAHTPTSPVYMTSEITGLPTLFDLMQPLYPNQQYLINIFYPLQIRFNYGSKICQWTNVPLVTCIGLRLSEHPKRIGLGLRLCGISINCKQIKGITPSTA